MGIPTVIIILDGLGDRPNPALGGLTPLEAAATPNFDALAAFGLCGMVDPLAPGFPVGTHTGTAVLMGLPTRFAKDLPRGPIEALGAGATLAPGDVALRGNFATLDEVGGKLTVIDRRAGRIDGQGSRLCDGLAEIELADGVRASVTPATLHRVVVVLRGKGLVPEVCNTDPGKAQCPIRSAVPLRLDNESARRTALAVNEFVALAHEHLQSHPVNVDRVARGLLPANGIITRGAGMLIDTPSLLSHLGLKVAVVAGEKTVLGLARHYGFEAITAPAFTTLVDTNLEAKVAATHRAMEEYDIVFLHVKATDILAHDCNPTGKRDFIERADRIMAPLLSRDHAVVVTADHTTNSNTGHHAGDPVPTLFHVPNGRRDGQTAYSESQCLVGGLGRIRGYELLTSLLDATNRMHNVTQQDALYV